MSTEHYTPEAWAAARERFGEMINENRIVQSLDETGVVENYSEWTAKELMTCG